MQDNFSGYTDQIQHWLLNDVLILSTATQLLVIVLTYILAQLLAKRLASRVHLPQTSWFVTYNFEEVVQGLVGTFFWAVLLWTATFGLERAGYGFLVTHISATLATAWVLIRITASFVKNAAFAKLITITVWTITALNLLGWLEPTLQVLDQIGFSLGEARISALTITKAIIALIVLLWLAGVLSRLFERSIKQQYGLDPSLRVLFSKLVKISLIVIAVLAGLGAVGVDVSAFAVFGGAIGLGIGFGLQKVVSNLICGVILLLDRSIKPGDVIALQEINTFGRVNRLEARCVSVLTRDGEEHLIPNEDFITTKVVNWSYSSRNVRQKIPVGISYDDDPHRAMEILVEAANKQERVLKDPEPVARLVEFGDSSLNLELRVWIRDPEDGVVNIRSGILLAIWDTFKEEGITIPFPQRVVHQKPLD